ncbi:hypothetical protein [Ureaplasma canigenitalium]|uniref:hypothetical protein n=1 Tax=Ureaplasma canigenitalium TaxID=42092 RepID=UPI000A58019B|nr:hypothetical protein [Ureaplasma canigenitalium]
MRINKLINAPTNKQYRLLRQGNTFIFAAIHIFFNLLMASPVLIGTAVNSILGVEIFEIYSLFIFSGLLMLGQIVSMLLQGLLYNKKIKTI